MQNGENFFGKEIAEQLLAIEAVRLNVNKPFLWASGWQSPIYCDNRQILSHPEFRTRLKTLFARQIAATYPQAELIAGVATGAIAIGALVADALEKPFVYVRPKPKTHGLGNQIEGKYHKGQKVVVIEDLISTGKSSLAAVQALRRAECRVLGMGAVFHYGFEVAKENFAKAGCELFALSNYSLLLEKAVETGYITTQEIPALRRWRENPAQWTSPAGK